MWLVFSLVFWISTILGFSSPKTGAIVMAAGCAAGIPLLAVVYSLIYRKYKK